MMKGERRRVKVGLALVVAVVVVCFLCVGEAAPSESTLFLEHSIAPGQWKSRGQLTYNPTQVVSTSPTSKRQTRSSQQNVRFLQSEIPYDDKAKIKELCEKGELYQIRVRKFVSGIGEQSVLASIRASDLINSGFKDKITLHVDLMGEPISIDYSVDESRRASRNSLEWFQNQDSLETTVKLASPVEGTKPMKDQSGFGHTPTAGGASSASKESDEDNRSWVVKYWYYVVPGVLILLVSMVSGGMQEEEKPEGEAQDASAQARPAVQGAAKRPATGNRNK